MSGSGREGGARGDAVEHDTDPVIDAVLADMEMRPAWVGPVCEAAGIPSLDVTTTAMSMRAAALGLRSGRGFCHHELRVRKPMPEGLEPEVAVWDGGTVPEWRDGVLAEPKYFSFFQDAPLPVFNPNYRGKWRPHELLHGAVGFYWHPEMTRFEFYVGARVAEILPVVHWYAFDEMFRSRCPVHRHCGAIARHCVACEASRRACWEVRPTAEDVSVAAGLLRAGLDHLRDELDACGQEMATGRAVARPRPGLDSSSDAQGYLRSHWNRSTAWSFGSWVELFLDPGEDYLPSVRGLIARVENVAAALLEPAVGVDPGRFERLFARRALQDLGYRVLVELERLGEDHPAQNKLWPLLEDAGGVCSEALDAEAPVEGQLHALAHAAREAGVTAVSAQGLPGQRRAVAELDQIVAGLGSVFRAPPDRADVERFVSSAAFWGPGRLASRYTAHVTDARSADPLETPVEAQRRLEAWVAEEPRIDPEAECFAGVPDSPRALLTGRLRVTQTLRRDRFPASVLGEDAPRVLELACVVWDGDAKVIAVTDGQAAVLDWLGRGGGGDCPDEAALLELVHVGAVAWFPPLGDV